MKRIKRILLALGCVALLGMSWITAITAQTDAQRQEELIRQAAAYTEDEIYIRAVPLLEEAAGYADAHTLDAETALKDVYLHLIEQSGFATKYTDLLEKQMARVDASPEIFEEAAGYYLEHGEDAKAFAILRDGVSRTGDEALTDLYESKRYKYEYSVTTYEAVAPFYDGAAQVMKNGRWGLADGDGEPILPCEYDQISTWSGDRAAILQNGVLSAIDGEGNRVALFHGKALGFRNLGEARIALQTPEGWILANGEFQTASLKLEDVGMCAGGCIPAKLDGKWGVLDRDCATWLVSPQYDGIVQDELGRCCGQNAVFVQTGGEVRLLIEGEDSGRAYEDARPFDDGWAAVKKGGKWGFIDLEGNLKIDYRFEDALSFSGHLAAVQLDGAWGYVSLRGELAIEPEFLEAKNFENGHTQVRTRDGWLFLSLVEYQEGGSGL